MKYENIFRWRIVIIRSSVFFICCEEWQLWEKIINFFTLSPWASSTPPCFTPRCFHIGLYFFLIFSTNICDWFHNSGLNEEHWSDIVNGTMTKTVENFREYPPNQAFKKNIDSNINDSRRHRQNMSLYAVPIFCYDTWIWPLTPCNITSMYNKFD